MPFRLANTDSSTLAEASLNFEQTIFDQTTKAISSSRLGPGESQDIYLSGLIAQRPGNDIMTVHLTVSYLDAADAAYVGRFEVVVKPTRDHQQINVNVHAGENMVADFEGMIQLGGGSEEASKETATRQWEVIPLAPDEVALAGLA